MNYGSKPLWTMAARTMTTGRLQINAKQYKHIMYTTGACKIYNAYYTVPASHILEKKKKYVLSFHLLSVLCICMWMCVFVCASITVISHLFCCCCVVSHCVSKSIIILPMGWNGKTEEPLHILFNTSSSILSRYLVLYIR